MTKKTVLVLGGTGMLGSMVVDVLSRRRDFVVHATARDETLVEKYRARATNVSWKLLDALTTDERVIAEALDGIEWVVNAIGLTKPCIHDDNAAEVERAIRVNSLFPHLLARAAGQAKAHVLQIPTDCVFSGAKGRYAEIATHDSIDVYGKSKSLGEVNSSSMHNLRTSIIGPEPKEHKFLLDWFLGQPHGAKVNGFTNHHWNGVTTLHFANLCAGIIQSGMQLPLLQHVIPADIVTKCEMLQLFADAWQRTDVVINATAAAQAVDRSLATTNGSLNQQLWAAAGYANPPTVTQMVEELREFDCRFVIK